MTDPIRRAFAEYFSTPGLELPEGGDEQGELYEGRWHVRYAPSLVDGERVLDFYAVNRFTNDRHVRIHADGRLEELEALRDGFSYRDDVPGDEQRAEREYYEYNRRVLALLRQKGLAS